MTSMQEIIQITEDLDYEDLSEQCITTSAKLISSLYNGSRDKIVEALAAVDIATARMSCLLRCDDEKSEIIRAKLAREREDASGRA